MKKQLFFLLLTVLMIAMNTNATVWRVSNVPGVTANFATFSAAQSAAYVIAGDTLYMEPGAGTYGDVTVTKQLVIIGNGYFLSENPETQANISTSRFENITLNNGCQGTIIQGCQFVAVYINTSNILIQRNYLLSAENSYYDYGIIFNSNNISNVIIRDNYLLNTYTGSSGQDVKTINSSVTGVNNVTISNNFIKVSNTSYNACRSIYLSSGFSGTVENNVISGNVEINNTVFRNNILISGTFAQTACTYTNNIGNSTQFGIANGNLQNVNMTNVFVGAIGNSTDGQYQLKTGSPAIGAGYGGIDCGMFGGQFPYVLSGLPAIPAIYFNQQTINNVNQQINVDLKTKSHN